MQLGQFPVLSEGFDDTDTEVGNVSGGREGRRAPPAVDGSPAWSIGWLSQGRRFSRTALPTPAGELAAHGDHTTVSQRLLRRIRGTVQGTETATSIISQRGAAIVPTLHPPPQALPALLALGLLGSGPWSPPHPQGSSCGPCTPCCCSVARKSFLEPAPCSQQDRLCKRNRQHPGTLARSLQPPAAILAAGTPLARAVGALLAALAGSLVWVLSALRKGPEWEITLNKYMVPRIRPHPPQPSSRGFP